MKLLLSFALLIGFVANGPNANAVDLDFQLEKSSIGFVGAKSDGKHEGGFKKFDVAAVANLEEPTKGSISIEIDTRSLWSDDDKLTNHLKSPDFFDVRNNPTITFESTKVIPGDEQDGIATGVIKGDLNMLGKTVSIEVPVKVTVTKTAIDVTAEFTIDRTKWGMTYGQGKVEDDVKIKVNLSFKI